MIEVNVNECLYEGVCCTLGVELYCNFAVPRCTLNGDYWFYRDLLGVRSGICWLPSWLLHFRWCTWTYLDAGFVKTRIFDWESKIWYQNPSFWLGIRDLIQGVGDTLQVFIQITTIYTKLIKVSSFIRGRTGVWSYFSINFYFTYLWCSSLFLAYLLIFQLLRFGILIYSPKQKPVIRDQFWNMFTLLWYILFLTNKSCLLKTFVVIHVNIKHVKTESINFFWTK